jgi:hypothetical protein
MITLGYFYRKSLQDLMESLIGSLPLLLDSGGVKVEEFTLGAIPPRFVLGTVKQTRDGPTNNGKRWPKLTQTDAPKLTDPKDSTNPIP